MNKKELSRLTPILLRRNKRGETKTLLPEEVIKVVVAVLAILLVLIPLSVKLVGIAKTNNEANTAKATLEEIINWSENAKVGDIKRNLNIQSFRKGKCIYLDNSNLPTDQEMFKDGGKKICFAEVNNPHKPVMIKSSQNIVCETTGATKIYFLDTRVFIDGIGTEGYCNIDGKQNYLFLDLYRGKDNLVGLVRSKDEKKDDEVFSFLTKLADGRTKTKKILGI